MSILTLISHTHMSVLRLISHTHMSILRLISHMPPTDTHTHMSILRLISHTPPTVNLYTQTNGYCIHTMCITPTHSNIVRDRFTNLVMNVCVVAIGYSS